MNIVAVVAILTVVFLLGIVFNTATLGATLWVVEEKAESSFQADGRLRTWAVCLGIVSSAHLVALIPCVGGLLGLVVLFVGTMAFLQKSFWQAFLLLLATSAVGFVVLKTLGWVLQLAMSH